MRKILLTSAGFENPSVQHCFLELLRKPASEARALFIPTAAIDEDAKAVLPKCRGDLLGAGVLPERITDFDLDREMDADELGGYDAVYFCGGSTEHLLERVKAVGFDRALDAALERGLVYVGVSAGSIISAGNLPGNLGYLPRKLEVHCESGSPRGPLPKGTVYLTNAQAVKVLDEDAEIIE
ncbi:Type 1 glutamine amidotransferase-like domain-containing protein [Acutalibacter muris]|uniref:Type 1 glutamine amidotransferase-like domain-containing protein n=1 Tax=Acutalibacter muris TaxID=1796620 RepID=UPI00272DFFB7|nr:Type 1 glutamine amidotransferase-like domain-containing protein [Acutalibacter muris]